MGAQNGWPPPREWDGAPFESQILSGGKLKIWGPVSPATGTRLSRVFYHDENGDFVVEQTVSKVEGAPVEVSLWSVAQIAGANLGAVFLPRAESSDYENGFRWLNEKPTEDIMPAPRTVVPKLLQVAPADVAFKIGADASRAAIAAVRGNEALVLKAEWSDGKYPDGENGKRGLPVEFFSDANASKSYVELELLSPLMQLKEGERQTHAIRWSLHSLPSADASDAKVHAAIDELMD